MYRIEKEFAFSAAHQLFGLREGHQCARLHGHNYRVVVALQARELDATGFVRDYGDLDELKVYLDSNFDHRFLNNVANLPVQTSAENIAKALYEWCVARWPEVCEVRVSETPKTWSSYVPG